MMVMTMVMLLLLMMMMMMTTTMVVMLLLLMMMMMVMTMVVMLLLLMMMMVVVVVMVAVVRLPCDHLAVHARPDFRVEVEIGSGANAAQRAAMPLKAVAVAGAPRGTAADARVGHGVLVGASRPITHHCIRRRPVVVLRRLLQPDLLAMTIRHERPSE